ncbi:DUF2441 domain-containing protein [Solidesulfovibrio sp. C21]|uniref:DUF2441 domain-containing protein n=1 Tax=Solidesulfovibrio sp. C21 TaxID=3398613 RepID=UPI0039FC9DD2
MKTNLELYHVNRKLPWGGDLFEVGKSYSIGDRYNPFFSRFYSSEPRHPMAQEGEDCQSLFEKLQKDIASGQVKIPNDIFTYAEVCVRHYRMLSRELLFDMVRVSMNPSLPSRMKSLFMTELDGIERWINVLGKDVPTQVVRCLTQGKIFKVDSNLIDAGFKEGLGYWQDSALKYWAGQSSDKPKYEYLVEGTVTVLQVI